MPILATMLGAAFIAIALRDVFQQLFHPGAAGSLARSLMRAVWGLFRRVAAPRRRAWLSFAGPVALLAVIAGWVVLLWAGWALVYWPHMPENFSFSPGLDRRAQDGFVDALYLSLMTMTTLGYGDISPSAAWLRMLATLQALTGFGLLTASVTWVLSRYPAFYRRQSLAQEISLVGESEHEDGDLFDGTSADAADRTLKDLTSGLVGVQGDLVRFPVTYYFHNVDERASLPAVMPYLLGLAKRATGEERPPEVKRRGAMLRGAIDDFAATLAGRFVGSSNPPSASTGEVLEAYAEDNMHPPSRRPA
ncbi:MAG: potassium channel family protein [Actinomycetota bacterium]|nr:potassium channel family protein [Actinomycetota bacterium]